MAKEDLQLIIISKHYVNLLRAQGFATLYNTVYEQYPDQHLEIVEYTVDHVVDTLGSRL